MKELDSVKAWLDNVAYSHSQNQNTGLAYRYGLEKFCKFIDATPQAILEDYEHSEEKEFRRKYGQFLRGFIGSLTSEGFTINTVDSRVAAVRSFFKYNDLPLGFVPIAHKRVVYHNRDIAKEEVVEVLKISDVRDKAFFCMMAQSGLRPETLCNLRLRHIEPDFSKGVTPCKVDVPEELSKGKYHGYFSFMGEESVAYLKAYLNERPGIGLEAFLFTNHGSEDQANPKSFSRIFARTVQKLKAKGVMDYQRGPKKKPSEVRLYNLRKYFRKFANQAGFENVQFWMGHTVKEGVDEHYRPKDVEHYREIYLEKAMPFLRFETHTPNENEKQIEELRQQLTEERERNQGMLEEFNQLKWEWNRTIELSSVEMLKAQGMTQEQAEKKAKEIRYLSQKEAEQRLGKLKQKR